MTREFSQIDFIAGILFWLDEHGIKELIPRQLNAVVKAADEILKELDKPHTPAVPGMGLMQWSKCDDTGMSSKYMASVLSDTVGPRPYYHEMRPDEVPHAYPRDASDFGRCVKLLDAVPEFRPHVSLLTKPEHGPNWNAVAAVWDELEALYRAEASSGSCPKLNERLNVLVS